MKWSHPHVINLPETTSLESQIAQLQSQIAAAQERITHLSEAEFMIAGAIVALQTTVQKISTLAPDAIASLKSAVLNLFGGSDDQGNDDGNQPSTPTPNTPTGGHELEPRNEITVVWATYEPSPERCELASWLTCDVSSGQKSDLIDRWWHELIHQKIPSAS